MQTQRWFVSSDSADTVTIKGRWVIAAGDPQVDIFLVESGSSTYVVPLVLSSTAFEHDLITKDRGKLV